MLRVLHAEIHKASDLDANTRAPGSAQTQFDVLEAMEYIEHGFLDSPLMAWFTGPMPRTYPGESRSEQPSLSARSSEGSRGCRPREALVERAVGVRKRQGAWSRFAGIWARTESTRTAFWDACPDWVVMGAVRMERGWDAAGGQRAAGVADGVCAGQGRCTGGAGYGVRGRGGLGVGRRAWMSSNSVPKNDLAGLQLVSPPPEFPEPPARATPALVGTASKPVALPTGALVAFVPAGAHLAVTTRKLHVLTRPERLRLVKSSRARPPEYFRCAPANDDTPRATHCLPPCLTPVPAMAHVLADSRPRFNSYLAAINTRYAPPPNQYHRYAPTAPATTLAKSHPSSSYPYRQATNPSHSQLASAPALQEDERSACARQQQTQQYTGAAAVGQARLLAEHETTLKCMEARQPEAQAQTRSEEGQRLAQEVARKQQENEDRSRTEKLRADEDLQRGPRLRPPC
ncbi:hypothetical protein FRC06_010847 [Ceratobasidium sp. 370]|nr:hypothetical protein FRC06_010847 [Ceratobasidium sp. 370]